MLAVTVGRLALADHFAAIYVINLDRRPDRWAFFQREFSRSAGRHELPLVERVPAADGAVLDPQALHKHGVLSALGLRRLQAPAADRIWGMDLSPGAVGCAVSHIGVWARIAAAAAATSDQQSPPRYLVMEDDCVFPPSESGSFEALYCQRLAQVPSSSDSDGTGWDLMYLSGLDTAGQCPSLAVAEGISRVPQFHRTTNAYVVTPAGAAQLLSVCLPLTYQLDTMMTMNVALGPSLPLPYVQKPRCFTLMPPLLLQSAVVVGDIQDGEAARTDLEREGEEAARRRSAGW